MRRVDRFKQQAEPRARPGGRANALVEAQGDTCGSADIAVLPDAAASVFTLFNHGCQGLAEDIKRNAKELQKGRYSDRKEIKSTRSLVVLTSIGDRCRLIQFEHDNLLARTGIISSIRRFFAN